MPDDQWQVQLHDLASDVGERTDLAAARPEVVARLVGHMRAAWVDDVVREPYGESLDAPGLLLPGTPSARCPRVPIAASPGASGFPSEPTRTRGRSR